MGRGAYPKRRRGNRWLVTHLQRKQQRQQLFQRARCHLPPPGRTDVSRMSCYRARNPQGKNSAQGMEVGPLHQPESVGAGRQCGRSAGGCSVFSKIYCFKPCFSPFCKGTCNPCRPAQGTSAQRSCTRIFWFLPLGDRNPLRIGSLTPLRS